VEAEEAVTLAALTGSPCLEADVAELTAADGTWHRPLTTLELAVLQGIPAVIDGRPLKLAGSSSTKWRERIGNAVPPPTARAIAEQMLVALVEELEGTMLLRADGSVWVEPEPQHDARRLIDG